VWHATQHFGSGILRGTHNFTFCSMSENFNHGTILKFDLWPHRAASYDSVTLTMEEMAYGRTIRSQRGG
jgi:hypothetical protein